MNHSRREFLQLSGSALAAIVISRRSCELSFPDGIGPFGIQMYSVKDLYEKDPKAALKKVAKMGYKYVETYERNEDIFWKLTNKGYKSFVEDLGMRLISSHCEIEKNFEKKAEQAAEIGMDYLVNNWPFSQQTLDEYKQRIDQYNKCGEICKKAGIRFGYHNYSSNFIKVDGIYPEDLIMERTDRELVHHQMDMGWVAAAGQDPEVWIKKHPGRYKLCHMKDRTADIAHGGKTCDLGKGMINWKNVLKTAKEDGMKYFLVEQEDFVVSEMESAEKNAKYLKKLSL